MAMEQLRQSEALEIARGRRADLHRSLVEVEMAIAAPVAGRASEWLTRVFQSLLRLREAFDQHVVATEGAEGLFAEVVRLAPRLAGPVGTLADAHGAIREEINTALAAVHELEGDGERANTVRERILALLAALSRHRQHGADLVYEAYAVDIGGGD